MGKSLVGVAVFVVAVILGLGLYTLFKGGDVSATWSNQLMRMRVMAQFIAIIIIMLVLWASQSGH
jgi:hypothetical protein